MLADSLYGIKKASQLRSKAALQGLLSWLYLIVFAVAYLKTTPNGESGRRSTAEGNTISTELQLRRPGDEPSSTKKKGASIKTERRARRCRKTSSRNVGRDLRKAKHRVNERRNVSKRFTHNLHSIQLVKRPREIDNKSSTLSLEKNSNPNPALFYIPDSATGLFRNPNTNNSERESLSTKCKRKDLQLWENEEKNKTVTLTKTNGQSNKNDTIYVAQQEYKKLLKAFKEKHTKVQDLQASNKELQASITEKEQQLSRKDALIREQQSKLVRYENSVDVEARVNVIMKEHEEKITELRKVWLDRKLDLEKRISELATENRGITSKTRASGYITRLEDENEFFPKQLLTDTTSNTTTTSRESSIGTHSLSSLSEEKSIEEIDDFDVQMAKLVALRKRNLRLENQLYGTDDGLTWGKDTADFSLHKRKIFTTTPGMDKCLNQARLSDIQTESSRYSSPETPQIARVSAY